MKLYILVEVYQLIVSGVYVSTDLEKVKAKFKEFTGVDYDEYSRILEEDENLSSEEVLGEDYDQTKIFEFNLKE